MQEGGSSELYIIPYVVILSVAKDLLLHVREEHEQQILRPSASLRTSCAQDDDRGVGVTPGRGWN